MMLETTWFVSQSGRCDQASGCRMRFMRTVIRFLSSAKIAGMPSQCVCEGSGGIQYTPSGVKRSMYSCHCLLSSNSACWNRNCSIACCVSWWPAPFALRRTSFFNTFFSLATHVLRPRLHLVPHWRFRGAAVRRGLDDAILFQVAAHMAREAHPLAGVGREPLVALPEVLQVVCIDQRGGRVHQVVI